MIRGHLSTRRRGYEPYTWRSIPTTSTGHVANPSRWWNETSMHSRFPVFRRRRRTRWRHRRPTSWIWHRQRKLGRTCHRINITPRRQRQQLANTLCWNTLKNWNLRHHWSETFPIIQPFTLHPICTLPRPEQSPAVRLESYPVDRQQRPQQLQLVTQRNRTWCPTPPGPAKTAYSDRWRTSSWNPTWSHTAQRTQRFAQPCPCQRDRQRRRLSNTKRHFQICAALRTLLPQTTMFNNETFRQKMVLVFNRHTSTRHRFTELKRPGEKKTFLFPRWNFSLFWIYYFAIVTLVPFVFLLVTFALSCFNENYYFVQFWRNEESWRIKIREVTENNDCCLITLFWFYIYKSMYCQVLSYKFYYMLSNWWVNIISFESLFKM